MADFPYPSRFHLPVITTYSRESGLGQVNTRPFTAPSSATAAHAAWPTANLVFLCPFVIWAPYLVRSVFWANSTAVNGNIDCGVYTSDAAELLFNAGTTTQSGTTTVQTVAVGPYLLEPGTYYMALVNSGTTGTIASSTAAGFTTYVLETAGCAQSANGALPLAASQTLAAPSSFGGVLAPLYGISSRASTLV